MGQEFKKIGARFDFRLRAPLIRTLGLAYRWSVLSSACLHLCTAQSVDCQVVTCMLVAKAAPSNSQLFV